MEKISEGKLYVVATPIGNLEDISTRARRILSEVDKVLCEDTRHFKRLSSHLGIDCVTQSYHEHNEISRAPALAEEIKKGVSMALISDAGTPTINDPGYRLINMCWEESIPVIPVPGPSALITALSCSGFETHRFIFEGYLPVKGQKKISTLEGALEFDSTSIFYESPHRIVKTLEQLETLEPNREIFLARELTKKFEECLRGPVQEVKQNLSSSKVKGEFVLIVRGKNYSNREKAAKE